MNILFSDSSYKQHIIDLLHFYMEQDRKVHWGYKKPRGDLNSKEQAFGLAADMGGPGCVTPAMLCPRKSLITLATFVLEQSNSTFPLSRETKSCSCPEKPFPWACSAPHLSGYESHERIQLFGRLEDFHLRVLMQRERKENFW